MDGIKSFFSQFIDQARTFWDGLNTVKKLAIIGAFVLSTVGLSLYLTLKEDKNYKFLFQNLGPADVGEVTEFLKKNNMLDYMIDSRGILVPEEQVADYRMKLAEEGLPSHGVIGWEKFDNPDFTRTDFEQRIHKLRAIQGELSRTIMEIEGVSTARVHIVAPKKSIFIEDTKDPTAAVYIKNRRGFRLSQKQIRGIVHMISKSVEGLVPENITIIDQEGRMLTDDPVKDPTAKQTKEMLTYKRSLENELENRVRKIVGRVVGPDRVEAKVNIAIDYTQERQTISDIDPDKVAIVSSNTNNMSLNGTGLNPTGIPGAKSNVPGEQEATNLQTSQTTNTRDTERVNYEISKTVKHKILPVGQVKRITAAVLVDGKQPYPLDGTVPEFQPRTKEEIAKIVDLVKNTIGFVDGRDIVNVENMLFQLDHVQVQEIREQKRETREYMTTLVLSLMIALAIVCFFAWVVRPYFRWLSYDPERKEKQSIIEEFKPDLELSSIQNVQVKEDVPFDMLTPQEQVLYVAKNDPERTTEAIRVMLNPHQSVSA